MGRGVVFRQRTAVPGIEAPAAGSLAAALGVVPDPRRPYGWRPGREPIPPVALLRQTGVALPCGGRGQSAVAQWGRERLEDDPGLLAGLGLPPGRSPRVATPHRLYKRLAEVDVRDYVTSPAPQQADADALPAPTRGHWGSENRLHHVRDVTFEEDRSQMRRGAVPQTFAACRNLAIGLLRSTGAPNIAAALRTYTARPAEAALLVLSTGRL